VFTKKEIKIIYGGSKKKGSKTCSENEIIICKGPWALNHSCPSDMEVIREEQLKTPLDHGDSSLVGFTSFRESTHEGSKQSSTNGEKKQCFSKRLARKSNDTEST